MKKIEKAGMLKLILLILLINLNLNLVYAQCSPNVIRTEWVEWENTTTCNSYNEINQRRFNVEYDANDCGSVDNKTSYEYRTIRCNNIEDIPTPVENKNNEEQKESSLSFLQFFGFLNNKTFIYALISITVLMALVILFVLLSKSLSKKKDINELLKEGYKYLENEDIKNARDVYYKIKKTYEKSGSGQEDAMYLRILEFYDAIIRSSLKSFSFKS